MKRIDIFLRFVNLFALSGYIMNIISLLTSPWWNVCGKINAVFHLFLLVFLLTLEIQEPIPNLKYVQFMAYPFGRGLFYLWLSFIVLHDSVISIVGTSLTGTVGGCYLVVTFFQACRGHRESGVVLPSSRPTSADYTGNMDSEESLQGASSTSPLLPGYAVSDPNKL